MDNDNQTPVEQLLQLLVRLRDPEIGTAWDKSQTFESISRNTIEETYELLEAIDNKDWNHVKEELGDMLLHVTYLSQIASEKNLFNFSDVANGIVNKILRRYKDVLNSKVALTPEQVAQMWDKVKAEEKKNKPKAPVIEGPVSLSFGPKAAPSLTRAMAVAKRALEDNMSSGKDAKAIAAKAREELDEVLAAKTEAHRAEELGDVLFSVVSLCGEYNVDPERALQTATNKFIRRWQSVYELAAADGIALPDATNKALDKYWSQVKKKEKSGL